MQNDLLIKHIRCIRSISCLEQSSSAARSKRRSPWAGKRIGEASNPGPAGPFVSWDDTTSDESVEGERQAADAAARRAMPLKRRRLHQKQEQPHLLRLLPSFFRGLREEAPAEPAFAAQPFDAESFRKASHLVSRVFFA